ncbi:hypothetical protein [Ancylobacter sp. TS-1]|uniref:hypothetical protein n=1 Tax=Ancylobacter sp. TS-1 TaxID=1850374 RepID=UPI001265C1AD|nr:hypothetical protein [Ancylobacter sp. TS-1]QFR32243.1 hypothetical protein GBB76_03435 [Ancylobacter sp. TS-1]
MALLAFWNARPEEVRTLSLEQVVSAAGDGRLRDGSECAREFRAFLADADADMLARYVAECIEEAGGRRSRNGFDGSGLALQDVVNEIGRRLDFNVEDGLYQGRRDAIGYDGIWRDGQGGDLVVEVKTTEAYSIDLNVIEAYRQRLIDAGRVSEQASILFVVGRKETGALEAQIRGSRHAWTMRMIGIAALVRLLEVKVNAEAAAVAAQIRALLRPVEYTRLDGIVDLVFRVRQDVEEATSEAELLEDATSSGRRESRRQASGLPAPSTESFREAAAERISRRLGVRLVRRRRSLFETADGSARVVVAVSKRYARSYQAYWYAYYDTQKAWLEEAQNAWIALCAADCGDLYLVPAAEIARHLDRMNVTNREADRTYWHLLVRLVDDRFVLVTGDTEISLAKWKLDESPTA